MRKFWYCVLFHLVPFGPLSAQEEAAFSWEPLEIKTSRFSRNLVMLDSERDEYATNLAAFASNQIAEQRASLASLALARRVLALAMHLSPRNKRAIITQFQLSKGILPDKVVTDYSPQVFARLLLTRGQLLQEQPEEENVRLAHYLIHLAAEMDPRNEDAVYASELIRLDHGSADWNKLLQPAGKEEG